MKLDFRDDPGSKKYVMKHCTKYSEKIMDSSMVVLSVMFTKNAGGIVLPPYVILNLFPIMISVFIEVLQVLDTIELIVTA